MYATVGALAAGYIIGMPTLMALFLFAHNRLVTEKKIERATLKKKKGTLKDSSKDPSNIVPLSVTTWERLNFLLKEDTRLLRSGSKKDDNQDGKDEKVPESGITNKQAFFGILTAGLIMFISPAFGATWWMLAAGGFTFYSAIGFASSTAKPIMEARKKAITKMVNIAKSKLGNTETNPSEIVTVLEWDQLVKPLRLTFTIPHTFNGEMGEDAFLRQFNQGFGQVRTFVPDNRDPQKPGWDYDQDILTLYAVPPLPVIAPFSEHYVIGEAIAKSFIPIGLGIDGGLELPNPETGEIEHVIGFDLAGEQKALADKYGIKVAENISGASPQGLVAGPTGGGKSLSIDTPVLIRVPKKQVA